MPQSHSTFEHLRSIPVDAINVTVEEYRHRRTGARHYHIAADDPQNVFLVGLQTLPADSTGVAHILEHTVLCGSERFPVRDPFFMMIRRSLNTFMNAFTASDWTAYPFATVNRKDYDNLLSVYLDAVFFANLDELDFAQEGHRVEFATPDDPETDLVYRGVVYNEMKGAMSSPVATLFQSLTRHLYPTTTYHHNSGGDPEAIPELTHDQLVAFYRHYYHPSNAVFMTYGDIPAHELQSRFEALALHRFEGPRDVGDGVPDEQRYTQPVAVTERYALDEEETARRTHVVTGWLLGHNSDPDAVLEAQLLGGVLLENSASPLLKALETSDLGTAPSPMCGLEDSNNEMFFSAGLEGSEPEHAEAVEQLILDTLRDVADNGVDPEMVESVFHQLELGQREITGDGFPYGLQLIVHALPTALHGGDPIATLDLDAALKRLREKVRDPGFVPGLARRLLLDNPHRVRLTLEPDTTLSRARAEAEKQRLAEMKAGLDETDRKRIVERAAALAERQNAPEDPGPLPRVGLEDVAAELAIPEGERHDIGDLPGTWYERGTNGLVYQQLVFDLPELDPQLLDLMPLFANVLPEVGSGGRDYLETQALMGRYTGGIGAGASLRGAIDDTQRARGTFTLSGKALADNREPLAELMRETIESARFDEHDRLRELLAQLSFQRQQAVTGNGHALAMTLAASGLSPTGHFAHRWQGLEGTRAIKALEAAGDIGGLARRLEALRDALPEAPRQLVAVTDTRTRAPLAETLGRHWGDLGGGADRHALRPGRVETPVRQAWTTNTQVNFCAAAYPAPPVDHPDAPALMVLGGLLRNGFLHRAIREQGGAYGAGAGYDADGGAFRFFSYRDPRLSGTLADFAASLDWIMEERHEWRVVEEAILGVVSQMDKPGSPAGEAKKAFHNSLHGRTPEKRRQIRARVLEVTLDDVRGAAERWLGGVEPNLGIISHRSLLEADGDLPELEIHEL